MKPKYLRKKKRPATLWLVVLAAVILAAGAIAAAVMAGNQEPEETTPVLETTEGTEAESTAPTTEPEPTQPETQVPVQTEPREPMILLYPENGQIRTPYLTLYYPEAFADYLLIANTSQDPYILEFYALLPERTEQRIFDIRLGGGEGNLGTVETDSGSISVSMTAYTFTPDDTWSQGEIDTVLAMQEASNELISRLGISGGGQAPEVEEAPEENTMVNFLRFETPYCELRYPAQWEEYLHVEQTETDGVHITAFYCRLEGREDILMFSILLGGDEGEQLGIVTNDAGVTVPVNLMIHALPEEGLEEDELTILYSMQEDVNRLLEQLPLR